MSEDIAWAAGLFEGEGCIHRRRGKLNLSVQMTDRDVVDRFARAVSVGGVAAKPQPGVRAYYKPTWRWNASGEEAAWLLTQFMPWLGDRRRARAAEETTLFEQRKALAYQPRACLHCGAEFVPAESNQAVMVRYCSHWCRDKAELARACTLRQQRRAERVSA